MPVTATQAPLLLCAATRWESAPLIKRWGLRAATPFRFEGCAGGTAVILIKTGMGAANAEEALNGFAGPLPRMAVSIGFAGALQPRMDSGDLVLDVQGLDIEIPQAAREIARTQKTPLHFGKIAYSDNVLSAPRDKAELGRKTRCSAVDMETASIRAWGQARGVPALAARVVLDGLQDRLPAETPKGERLSDLIPFLMKNAADLPLLARLGLRQKRAMAALAAFLEEFLPRL